MWNKIKSMPKWKIATMNILIIFILIIIFSLSSCTKTYDIDSIEDYLDIKTKESNGLTYAYTGKLGENDEVNDIIINTISEFMKDTNTVSDNGIYAFQTNIFEHEGKLYCVKVDIIEETVIYSVSDNCFTDLNDYSKYEIDLNGDGDIYYDIKIAQDFTKKITNELNEKFKIEQ